MMTVYWYPYNLQPYKVVSLVASATKCSILLQNMDCLGRIWLGLAKILALIALTVFMYLSNELILTCYWYTYNPQPCIAVIWAGFGLEQPLTYYILLQKWVWRPE